jgi:hypothetical protein
VEKSPIEAIDDIVSTLNGKDGTTAITGVDVLANDKLNGVILTSAVITPLKTGPISSNNTDGTVSADPNVTG